ncbi:hypothetical protein AB0B50_20435 [Streptomyces sp. NPDC041068]|uniref:hypothetical protein n=1 Tax=Streptomyces sp. NPDC041068 TaxID=3155130 RepID=UPI0033D313C2
MSATVLEDDKHGPQLCYNVLESLPPQCGGPDITDWDWTKVKSTTRNGTTWGAYDLVGTWDGKRFSLTAPAVATKQRARDQGEEDGEGIPCRRPADPRKATENTYDQVFEVAESLPGYAGGWVTYLKGHPKTSEQRPDYRQLAVTFRFTGDPERHRGALRDVWGGALCLTSAQRTMTELKRIQRKLEEDVTDQHVLSTGIDETKGRVDVEVILATPDVRKRLDDLYGKGATHVSGWLKPVTTGG